MCIARVLALLLCLFLYASAFASQEITFPIDIQGLQYDVIVIENNHIASKVSGIDESLVGKHYIGRVRGEENTWVRASLINNRWQGVVSIHNAMHMFEHEVSSVEGAASASAMMQSTPVMEVEGLMGGCGSGDGAHSMLSHMNKKKSMQGSAISSSAMPAIAEATFAQFCSYEVDGICVIAEVEIAFDLEFQNVFGAQSAAQAMSILNIVDGHYINDLRISIDAITVEMLSNDLFNTSMAASPVLNAGVVLTDIENKKNNSLIPFITNNSALTHLVTGRVFAGGTLGVAYLGSVCEANGFSTGTSGVYYSNLSDPASYNIALTAVVVAHELAHNLGSDHDGPTGNPLCPSSTYIMSPILGPGLTSFSTCSAADIEMTLSALVNPELCLDFPADVAIDEDSGNSGLLDINAEFISSYTVNVENGFINVDQIGLSGSINLAEGLFVSVTANGNACVVAAGGASYTCTVNNPPASFKVLANVRVNDPVSSSVTLSQTASEQTADVQEVNSLNNTEISLFIVENGMVESSVATTPSTPTNTPVSNTVAEEEGGGAGSLGFGLIILLMASLLRQATTRRHN